MQLLPAYNALVEEALSEAREINYLSVPTRVLRVEHLVAIALQTGRDQDRQRVQALLTQSSVDRAHLADVMDRHGLRERWHEWNP